MLKVVDENVLVVANDLTLVSSGSAPRCPGAQDDCRLRCVEALEDIIRTGDLVLDEGSEFLEKYSAHASFGGQPGIGDAFLRQVYERGYDPDFAVRVAIRQGPGFALPPAFLESGFDEDDFLWVAAAYNSPEQAEILNAVDSDYAETAADLAALPVIVRELCV